MKLTKVLIATAWWPTKSKYFEEYSKGVVGLQKAKIETELFITTQFHDSKFGSNFLAVKQCVTWAIKNKFTHILILDADITLSPENFIKMIKSNKDILLAGRGSGDGLCLMNNNTNDRIGWGCSLIKTEVFENVKLEYSGDFLTPDRLWLKKAKIFGYKVWCHFGVVPKILEESTNFPMSAFSGMEG